MCPLFTHARRIHDSYTRTRVRACTYIIQYTYTYTYIKYVTPLILCFPVALFMFPHCSHLSSSSIPYVGLCHSCMLRCVQMFKCSNVSHCPLWAENSLFPMFFAFNPLNSCPVLTDDSHIITPQLGVIYTSYLEEYKKIFIFLLLTISELIKIFQKNAFFFVKHLVISEICSTFAPAFGKQVCFTFSPFLSV